MTARELELFSMTPLEATRPVRKHATGVGESHLVAPPEFGSEALGRVNKTRARATGATQHTRIPKLTPKFKVSPPRRRRRHLVPRGERQVPHVHRREHALLAARAPLERVPAFQLALALRT